MARGELMKKLLASYGRDEEFRAVAEQITNEEEKKNNRMLARSLRKTLEAGPNRPSGSKALAPLIPFPEAAADFIERVARATISSSARPMCACSLVSSKNIVALTTFVAMA